MATRTWILRDGVFEEGGFVSAADRGFRYGMSVFETVGVWRGRRLFEREHLDALAEAARAAEFLVPKGLETAVKGLDVGGTGMLRFYVTAGEGGPVEEGVESGVFAVFDEVEFPQVAETESGVRVGFGRAPICPVLGGWKTGNYWTHVQALREARQLGLGELILSNVQGEVVSAAMANLFVVLNGAVRTPSGVSGARRGVVREWVMGRIAVEESPLFPDDVLRAEECFLTNSRMGVMPVAEIEGRRVPGGKTGLGLAECYREEVLAG